MSLVHPPVDLRPTEGLSGVSLFPPPVDLRPTEGLSGVSLFHPPVDLGLVFLFGFPP